MKGDSSTATNAAGDGKRPTRTAADKASAAEASPTGRRTLPPKQQVLPAAEAARSPRRSPLASGEPGSSGRKRRVQSSPQPLKTSSPRSSTPTSFSSPTSPSPSPAQVLAEELSAAQQTAARLGEERRRHSKEFAWAEPEPEPEPLSEPMDDSTKQRQQTNRQESGANNNNDGVDQEEDAESTPSPPWTKKNVVAAPKVKVLGWMQQHANPRCCLSYVPTALV